MQGKSSAVSHQPFANWKRLDVFVVALIIVIAIGARLLPGPRNVDDSFITFRYSRNILEGNGFVYNPSARVLGTTTPLFTLLMSGAAAVANGRDFPAYAIIVSAVADAANAVLLFLLMRRLTKNLLPAALIGLLWAIAPQSVTFAVGGMETSVNIFWILAALYCYLSDRDWLLGLCIGLGFLTRIDALLWIGPLLLHQLYLRFRVRGAIPLKTWIGAAAVVLPWLAFAYLYFGTIIPQSVTAKSVTYFLAPGSAFVTLLQNFGTPFSEEKTLGGAFIFLFFTYVALLVIGIIYAVRRESRLLPWLLYPFVYGAVFSIINPLVFRWYVVPPLPAIFFALVVGVWAVLSNLFGRRANQRVVLRFGFAAVGLFWISTSLNAWTLHPDHGLDRPAPQMAWHKIELYYRQMADDLVQKYGVGPASRIVAADIGVVGYVTNAQILDTVGLVSPEVAKYYPYARALVIDGQNYAVPPAIVRDARPEFAVFMESMVRNGLARDPDFIANYEQVRFIPTDFYGTGMLLYKRR